MAGRSSHRLQSIARTPEVSFLKMPEFSPTLIFERMVVPISHSNCSGRREDRINQLPFAGKLVARPANTSGSGFSRWFVPNEWLWKQASLDSFEEKLWPRDRIFRRKNPSVSFCIGRGGRENFCPFEAQEGLAKKGWAGTFGRSISKQRV